MSTILIARPSAPEGVNSSTLGDADFMFFVFHLPARPGPPDTRSATSVSSIASPFGFVPFVLTVSVFPSGDNVNVSVVSTLPFNFHVVCQLVGERDFQAAVPPNMAG